MDDDFLLAMVGDESSKEVMCVDKFIGDSVLANLVE